MLSSSTGAGTLLESTKNASISDKDFRAAMSYLKTLKLLDAGERVEFSIIHAVTVDALQSKRALDYLKVIEEVKNEIQYFFFNNFFDNALKYSEIRLAIYACHLSGYEEKYESAVASIPRDNFFETLGGWFLYSPVETGWLRTRHIEVQKVILEMKVSSFYRIGIVADQVPDLVACFNPLRSQKEYLGVFDNAFILHDIANANFENALITLNALDSKLYLCLGYKGIIAFLTKRNDDAIAYFEEAFKSVKKLTGKKKVSLGVLEMFFYCLSLFCTQDRKNYKKLNDIFSSLSDFPHHAIKTFELLNNVLLKLQGIESTSKVDYPFAENDIYSPFSVAIFSLANYWLNNKTISAKKYKQYLTQYESLCPLAAKIFAELIEIADPGDSENKKYLAQKNFENVVPFVSCVQLAEKWETVLDSLDYFFSNDKADSITQQKRLIWYVNPENRHIEALEQSSQAKGGWTKGRVVAMKHFYDSSGGGKLDYITELDKKLINTLINPQEYYDRYSYNYDFAWDEYRTPLALVGHQCVFHKQVPEMKLEFVSTPLELIVKEFDKKGEQYFHISLSHGAYMAKSFIEQETPSRYRVIEFPENIVPLFGMLGKDGIKIPTKAKDAIFSLLNKAGSSLQIRSELDDPNIPTQEGDSTPYIHLMPFDGGLKINLFVRPFSDNGPYLRAGSGNTHLIIFIDKAQLKAKRDLKAEVKKTEAVIKSCPTLAAGQDGSGEWILSDPEECLETLSILQDLPDVRIEWPEGQSLSVAKSSSFNNLSLKITRNKDWFSVGGLLKIDDDTVLDFQQLLSLMDSAQGRFIELKKNQFIALSNQFKKQLQDLKALGEETKDGYRIHNLGTLAVKGFVDKISNVEGDINWEAKFKTFQEMELFKPKLSKSLKVELRDYQKDGFDWISRLFYGGFGACLADDMGLGKTIQALAVIQSHASKGPCLIVAPTSVCHNWVAEIEKFAPTLSCHLLGEVNNREDKIVKITSNDILICSYTLLQQEIEFLEAKKWEIVVLDEAQAIKNSTTKRFQAAIQLNSKHRLALTGTPIENNLEEIWSLFRFVAPGLLGSKESFQKRFITSVNPEKDKNRRLALKNLIQLFMLRRTKNAVLQELPSRTEQTVFIDASAEESAFYEAIRRQALLNLSSIEEKKGGRKIHILAEISRLRRTCCHPKLTSPEINLPSSKLNVFFNLVDELLQNNHQALVFSQFVGYLDLVKKGLDEKNIPYQYLDGTMAALDRKKQVEDFQGGKSSLFLLSLKAGGTGLNLTAADYVIHLDPWWNPAVEDQAADRAHRMGQKRPVTIYRLIVRNSIEEKILALHKNKRDLADELLEGSNQIAKMTEEDLMELLSS
jgi:SNF2 family DNA or RNA helicase